MPVGPAAAGRDRDGLSAQDHVIAARRACRRRGDELPNDEGQEYSRRNSEPQGRVKPLHATADRGHRMPIFGISILNYRASGCKRKADKSLRRFDARQGTGFARRRTRPYYTRWLKVVASSARFSGLAAQRVGPAFRPGCGPSPAVNGGPRRRATSWGPCGSNCGRAELQACPRTTRPSPRWWNCCFTGSPPSGKVRKPSQTATQYLNDFKGFVNWLRAAGHVSKPLFGRRDKFVGKPRHVRRALTADEQTRLLDAAGASDHVHNARRGSGIGGTLRRLIFWTALKTGFRSTELQSLAVECLGGDTLRLDGCHTKNGDDAQQPLPPDLADALRENAAGKPAGARLLGEWSAAARMIRAGLKVAGIPYRTDDGVGDFHAPRVSFCTDRPLRLRHQDRTHAHAPQDRGRDDPLHAHRRQPLA